MIEIDRLPGCENAVRFNGHEHGAGTPRRFVNTGRDPLRRIDIHPVVRVEKEWLE